MPEVGIIVVDDSSDTESVDSWSSYRHKPARRVAHQSSHSESDIAEDVGRKDYNLPVASHVDTCTTSKQHPSPASVSANDPLGPSEPCTSLSSARNPAESPRGRCRSPLSPSKPIERDNEPLATSVRSADALEIDVDENTYVMGEDVDDSMSDTEKWEASFNSLYRYERKGASETTGSNDLGINTGASENSRRRNLATDPPTCTCPTLGSIRNLLTD
ncbi:uncharacterized protein B0I36DRAFT_326317, partial [Microdochium trichocladiopsis]